MKRLTILYLYRTTLGVRRLAGSFRYVAGTGRLLDSRFCKGSWAADNAPPTRPHHTKCSVRRLPLVFDSMASRVPERVNAQATDISIHLLLRLTTGGV